MHGFSFVDDYGTQGEMLQAFRQLLGFLDIQAFAEHTGIDVEHLQMVETHKEYLTPSDREKLLKLWPWCNDILFSPLIE